MLATVAFPAISCGAFGYPYREAAEIAISAVQEHHGNLQHVEFVLFDPEVHRVFMAVAQEMFGEGTAQ